MFVRARTWVGAAQRVVVFWIWDSGRDYGIGGEPGCHRSTKRAGVHLSRMMLGKVDLVTCTPRLFAFLWGFDIAGRWRDARAGGRLF